MNHIYIIEDDSVLCSELALALEAVGYHTTCANDFNNVLNEFLLVSPDLVILDINLPNTDGFILCMKIRKVSQVPIIFITGRDSQIDELQALSLGGDDYITKPFEIEELLARIVVQLRKSTRSDSSEKLMYREITVNMVTHEAWVGEHEVKLTKTEFAILKILLEHPKQVITKTVLLDRVSEETPDCMESSLRVHISNLRKKLREISGKDYIEAVWGIGFKMAE